MAACACGCGAEAKPGRRFIGSHNLRLLQAPSKCGTGGGYQKHRRNGEEACNACKAAQAEYMRQLRQSRPKVYDNEKRRNAARGRALWRLAEEHEDRFRELYLEEVRL